MRKYLVFYPVTNELGFERHTFDLMTDEEAWKELQKLEGARVYDMTRSDRNGQMLDLGDFVEDYNDEELDGGWWSIILTLPEEQDEERELIGYQIDFGEEFWPEGLFSFQVFRTKEAATEFLEEKKLDGFHLVEIYEGDIEEPSFIGMKPIVFKESLSEQELFDLFARVFQDEDVDIYNEDDVYGMATHLFAKSCGKIESIFTWLKDDDSTGEQCWYDEFHDEVVSLYCSMLKGEVRCCDYCGKPMKKGYYLFGEYACSDECCLALFNGDKEEMDESLSDDSGDNDTYYWTEWESIYKD